MPATALPTLEEWMDDLRAVLDDIGSEKAAIVTAMAGGFMACVFAATYPDRVRALVLIDGFARLRRARGTTIRGDPPSREGREPHPGVRVGVG